MLRSLEGLLDALDVDRCGISLFDDSTPGLVPHLSVSRPGVPPAPTVDLAPLMPWYAGEVRAGRTLVLARLPEDLPAEAAAEAAFARQSGMKAHVSVPMRVGGETQGGLGCALFREGRDWDPRTVTRLEVLGGIFGSAFYRARAEARVREAEDLNRSILASIPHELLVVGATGRVLALNEAWAGAASRGHFPPAAESDGLGDVLGRGALPGDSMRRRSRAFAGSRRASRRGSRVSAATTRRRGREATPWSRRPCVGKRPEPCWCTRT